MNLSDVPLTCFRRQVRKWFSLIGLLLSVGLIHGCHREIAMMSPNRQTPPNPLKQSTKTMVKSMYAHLARSNEQAAASKLYEILEPGVSIYYLFGPETKHPSHHQGEWQVNLYQSRWHAAVYPMRRVSANGKTYEMWVLFYCGGGKWSRRVRPHHFYFGAEVDNTTSRRRIIYRSEEFPGNPDVGISVKSLTLPNGALKLPLIAGES